jgi:hypothetical protein
MKLRQVTKTYGRTRVSVADVAGVSDEDVRLFVASEIGTNGPFGEHVDRSWEDEVGEPIAVLNLYTD